MQVYVDPQLLGQPQQRDALVAPALLQLLDRDRVGVEEDPTVLRDGDRLGGAQAAVVGDLQLRLEGDDAVGVAGAGGDAGWTRWTGMCCGC